MKALGPIVPPRLELRDGEPPRSLAHDDLYHPRAGAVQQARHVFLAGNGLPQRWQGRERFVVLETGFGLGNNFLATWQAWRADPRRCARLVFISIEAHPLDAATLRQVHEAARGPDQRELADLAAQLLAAWPPPVAQLHPCRFDDGAVELLLAFGDVAAWLPRLVATVDACFLDGFTPARNPAMWEPRLFKAIARLAAPDATAATWSSARAVRDGLSAAGFEVSRAAGRGGKRDITVARRRPAAAAAAAGAAARRSAGTILRGQAADAGGVREAVVVGAGLAGAASALALVRQGWRVTLLDRHEQPAREASGNPGGLFHGVTHGHDGPHARFHRACALAMTRQIRTLLARHPEARAWAAADGVLRLETSGLTAADMQARLDRAGLPPEVVRAVDVDEAGALAGLPLQHPAWFHPGGGWLQPAALVRHWIASAGPGLRWQGNAAVHRLQRHDGIWRVLDADGAELATAPVLVLATAGQVPALLPDIGIGWPAEDLRGQISWLPAEVLPAPRLPLAGAGYVLPPVDGRLVFGATRQADDRDGRVREADHAANLARLAELSPALSVGGSSPSQADGEDAEPDTVLTAGIGGRTAWRCTPHDRLPLVGAVPAHWLGAPSGAHDQVRHVPRAPGLYLCSGLGSRGITCAALSGDVLAALVAGAPVPLESDLLDAIDPARFGVRETRRQPR